MGKTVELAKKLYDKDIEVDDIPLDDQTTYDMLAKGETAATFQLNGAGMTRFLKELKPSNIDDINAMVALYRPGPMAFIPDYIERKHNPHKVKYLDPRFEEYLSPTYGILIYQDDIMLLAVNFAGYSWGEADKFRKAMGKKIPEIMAEQKEKFAKGCVEVGGLTEKQTTALWDQIETFAAYGFNKAHAASYGRIAYLTSYLKANYPVLYMTAVLTADQGDVEKVAIMVAECARMGIAVLPPDINESFEDFATVGKEKKIRFGLTTIKNFGEGIAHAIIEDRKASGPFTSLENFLNRLSNKSLNRKALEALIKAGALDAFGERGKMLGNLDELIQYNKELAKESKDQVSLFGGDMEAAHLKLAEVPEMTQEEKLRYEKELIGLYISGNPLDPFKEKLAKHTIKIRDLKADPMEGRLVTIGGIVSDVRIIQTKKGDDMAFIKIDDTTETMEAVVFPKIFEKIIDLMEVDTCLVAVGKISLRNGETSLLLDKAKRLEKKED
jgi:DNA polymerase-3 subunit alpha